MKYDGELNELSLNIQRKQNRHYGKKADKATVGKKHYQRRQEMRENSNSNVGD